MSKELKPCPFCGGEAMLEVIHPHEHMLVNIPPYGGSAFIECTSCSCAMAGETEAEVVETWNRRKPIDDIVERLERIAPEPKVECYALENEYNAAFEMHNKCIEVVKGGAE